MKVLRNALAGTLESSDVQITIEPFERGIELDISSTVLSQYGKQIRQVIVSTLERLGVETAKVTVVDHGALDLTIKARVETAVFRSLEMNENLPWGEKI